MFWIFSLIPRAMVSVSGHCRNYVPTDVLSRYYRMKGYNVLHPMGWDAFGLPAENAAIKLKTNPARLISRYSANYKRQFRLIGISFDWTREINSSSPGVLPLDSVDLSSALSFLV